MARDELQRSARISETQCKSCLEVLEIDWGIVQAVEAEDGESGGRGVRYRLAHDFLVPPLRRWLRLQRMQTGAGRAREALTAHASVADPRHVPSCTNWLIIRCRTRGVDWDERERSLMRRADLRYGPRMIAVGLALAAVSLAAWWLLT
jgi:hypothetical protein